MQADRDYRTENIAYWTGRAPGYSEVNKSELSSGQRQVWSGVLAEKIREHFPGKRPEELSVLDVGTGPGFFAVILAEMGYRVTAVDYTESMLEEARINAGTECPRIRFLRMNAEELEFGDSSFDVIVSRNLTWNLPHPGEAYQEWERVLKPGGLLLNFDANWYRYLYSEEAREGYLKDRENIKRSGVADETDGTDIPAMEAIACQAPLSAVLRPAWDRTVLEELEMEVQEDPEIWKRVWTREERINNSSTPMFLVHAVKKCAQAGEGCRG
jgi:ubiquinone/menaquinone biosynthesis C-methylase UbiE